MPGPTAPTPVPVPVAPTQLRARAASPPKQTVSPTRGTRSPAKRLTQHTIRETRVTEQIIRTVFEDSTAPRSSAHIDARPNCSLPTLACVGASDSQGERVPVRQEVVDGTPRVHREEMVTVERKRRGTSPTAPTVSTSGVSTGGAAHEQDDFSFVRRRSVPAAKEAAVVAAAAPAVTASAAPPATTAIQAATSTCCVCGSATTTGAWHPAAVGAGVQCEGGDHTRPRASLLA